MIPEEKRLLKVLTRKWFKENSGGLVISIVFLLLVSILWKCWWILSFPVILGIIILIDILRTKN